jgi:hypothetical protein
VVKGDRNMKKEIKELNKEKGIVRITVADERWYAIPAYHPTTGIPIAWEYLPSITWIASYYPKGIAFYKWLANKGWDEAEAIKVAAGDKGSKVHQACEDIEKGIKIPLNAKYVNSTTGQPEELLTEEIDSILSFCNWLDETKPELLANELTVIGDGHAGTLDRIYRINGQIYIVDLKTSQNIWEEHILQVSAYAHARIDVKELKVTEEEWVNKKLAILQLGYHKNKKGWKFTEVPDKYNLFLMAKEIWKNENPDTKPLQKDYPLLLEAKIRQKKED